MKGIIVSNENKNIEKYHKTLKWFQQTTLKIKSKTIIECSCNSLNMTEMKVALPYAIEFHIYLSLALIQVDDEVVCTFMQ